MLVVCSGSMICENATCPHKRTHYALHLGNEKWGRTNCASRRCTGAQTKFAREHDIDLYFECVPWHPGVEKTFVHPGMKPNEILMRTRWFDMNNNEDGYLDLDSDPDLGPEDDGGCNVPMSLVIERGVSTVDLTRSDPPWTGIRKKPTTAPMHPAFARWSSERRSVSQQPERRSAVITGSMFGANTVTFTTQTRPSQWTVRPSLTPDLDDETEVSDNF